jgi:glycosyltransferase involved in cell wall biosynthesis
MRILHVFRAPLGGLFRHVSDLVRGQVALGHEIGIFCDSSDSGDSIKAALEKIAPLCKLGIKRMPMSVLPNIGDFSCISAVRKMASENNIDIVHGHGAKGGLYARLAGKRSVYTPHGGSIHYNWIAFPGLIFMATEWTLRHFTSGLAFVCEFEHSVFARKVGIGKAQVNVIHNGLWSEEFKAVAPSIDSHDLLFVGEMCYRKGVEVLLRALAELKSTKKLTVAMVGDGIDIESYKSLATKLGLDDHVKFLGRMNIAKALSMGRVLVLPSRLESFPYVVLEAIAAGRIIISTTVGGLSEVLPAQMLVEPEDVQELSAKIADVVGNIPKYQVIADKLAFDAPRNFSAEGMVKSITDFYTRLM